MYENFYDEYLSIETNVKQAASNAASHSVSSNICAELETVINDLKKLNSSLESEKNDATVSSFSNGLTANITTIESVYNFLVADYTNVEEVYQLLKNDLDVLKELDEQLKSVCLDEPEQKDYKKKKTETTYNSTGGQTQTTVWVDDTERFGAAHATWESNVETIKTECRNVKGRVDEYLNYLKSVNSCLPTNGASGIQVPSFSTTSSSVIPLNMEDLSPSIYPESTSTPVSSGNITYEQTRYADTDVWYAIIPKGQEPKLAVSHNANGDVSSTAPSALADEVGAKVAINFSLTGSGYIYDKKKAYMGGGSGLLYDGEKLYKSRTNYHDTTLYMDQNGNLGYFYNNPSQNNGKTPEQAIEDLNPKWAAKTFYPIAVDGQYVDENKDPNIGGNSVNPRTFIGQTQNGDYFVGVCTGRNSNGKQKGMTLKEVYDFSQAVTGGNIKFLINGDGGGSSAFIYDGEKLNPNTDKTERARPDIIYWT